MAHLLKKVEGIREGDILKRVETGELLPVQHFYSATDDHDRGIEKQYICFRGFSVPVKHINRFFDTTGSFVHVFQ